MLPAAFPGVGVKRETRRFSQKCPHETQKRRNAASSTRAKRRNADLTSMGNAETQKRKCQESWETRGNAGNAGKRVLNSPFLVPTLFLAARPPRSWKPQS